MDFKMLTDLSTLPQKIEFNFEELKADLMPKLDFLRVGIALYQTSFVPQLPRQLFPRYILCSTKPLEPILSMIHCR